MIIWNENVKFYLDLSDFIWYEQIYFNTKNQNIWIMFIYISTDLDIFVFVLFRLLMHLTGIRMCNVKEMTKIQNSELRRNTILRIFWKYRFSEIEFMNLVEVIERNLSYYVKKNANFDYMTEFCFIIDYDIIV